MRRRAVRHGRCGLTEKRPRAAVGQPGLGKYERTEHAEKLIRGLNSSRAATTPASVAAPARDPRSPGCTACAPGPNAASGRHRHGPDPTAFPARSPNHSERSPRRQPPPSAPRPFAKPDASLSIAPLSCREPGHAQRSSAISPKIGEGFSTPARVWRPSEKRTYDSPDIDVGTYDAVGGGHSYHCRDHGCPSGPRNGASSAALPGSALLLHGMSTGRVRVRAAFS